MTPHLPGITPRPKAAVRSGLDAGMALYHAGFFWEAHEAWEPLWLAAAPNSRERALLQGLIQLANGRLKLAMGRAAAARRIARLTSEHLGRASPGVVMGVDTAWAEAERACLEAEAILGMKVTTPNSAS